MIRRSAIRNGWFPGVVFTLGGLFFFYASYLANGLLLALVTPPAWIALVIGVVCLYSAWQETFTGFVPDMPVADPGEGMLAAVKAANAAGPYPGRLSDLRGHYGYRFSGRGAVFTHTRQLDQFFERERVCVTAACDRSGHFIGLEYHLEDFPLLDRGNVPIWQLEAADEIVEQLNSGAISRDEAEKLSRANDF